MKTLVLLLTLLSFVSFSQPPIPDIGVDPNWVLNPEMSDEFNDHDGTTYDNSKWSWSAYANDPWPYNEYGSQQGTGCYDYTTDVLSHQHEGGIQYMKMSIIEDWSYCDDTDWNTYYKQFKMGGLVGLFQQQYGYFEIKFRSTTPSGYPTINHKGVSANAWLWRNWDPANGIWSEIDLCEMNCLNNQHTSNVHFDPNEYDGVPSHGTSPGHHEDHVLNWHTYSVSWFPNGIAIYIDGQLINSTTLGCPGMEEMNWLIGPGSAGGQFGQDVGIYSWLPYSMDVDYVRTYFLDASCDNQVINQCNYNVNSYDGNHKKSIRFGGSSISCATSVNSSTTIYMKAENFIELDGNFTVPVGATFIADVLPCMQ